MRRLATFFCLSFLAGASAAGEVHAATMACLSSGEAGEAVSRHQVVSPSQAIAHARRAFPNADVVRATLCREAEGIVYRITVLRKDGRLVRVTVDARSGRVRPVP